MATPVQTALRDVSVYVSGCIATRRGEVDLVQGRNCVYLAGITKSARDDSLRLRFAKGITQGQIRVVEKVPGHSGVQEEDAEALRVAHELDDAVADVQAKIDVCDVELSLWKKNGEFSYAGGSVSPQDAIAYMEQLPDRLDAVEKRKRELLAELKRLQVRLGDHMKARGIRRRTTWDAAPSPDKTAVPHNAPQAASAEFVLDRERDARYVEVELWAETDGAYAFDLQYWQDGATWKPLYEVCASTFDKPVDLRMRAQVVQTTKEDWRQVAVRLRTGNPSVGSGMTRLQPWYLDLKSSRMYERSTYSASMQASAPMPAPKAKRSGILGGFGSASSAMYEEAAASTGEFEPVLERAEVFEADRHDRQTMVEYELPGLWDIASGTDGQIVDLSRCDVAADFHCYAFPRADDAVHLSASIGNASEAFPLDGEATSYVDGALSGRFSIDAAAVAAQDFELPFGLADKVHVERKQVLSSTSSSALRNTTRTAFASEITVSNNRAESVDMVVIDQVPVSRDASVTVEVERRDGASIDAKTGEVRWQFELGAGQERSLRLEYSVSRPKKEEVAGLAGPDYSAPARTSSGYRDVGASRISGFCIRCGARIESGWTVCPHCGSRLPFN